MEAIKLHCPEILTWARVNEGLTVDEVSECVGINAKILKEYESGISDIDITALKILAKLYQRQITVFLLNKLPRQPRNIIDSIRVIYSDGNVEIFTDDKKPDSN